MSRAVMTEDTTLGRTGAVTAFLPEVAASSPERHHREIAAASTLQHP